MASKSGVYLVRSLVRASEILRAFRDADEGLRLRDVMERTRLSKGVCFRLLYTLRHCGLVEKVEDNRYHLAGHIGRREDYPVGQGVQEQGSSFAHEGPSGLTNASEEHVELIIVDNKYQPKVALRNVELLIPTAWTSSSNSRPTKGLPRRLRRTAAKRAFR